MTTTPIPPDWRGLCEELLDEVLARPLIQDRALIDRARAALAEPDGPTLQLPEQAPDEHPPSNLDRREVAAWYHGHGCGWQAARAVLARWGHQPAPPAEREVVGPSDESVEAAAQVIYGSMRFDRVDSTSDWAPNGNSFAQDEARRCARAVLARWGRPAPAPAGEVAKLVQPPGRAGLTWQGVIEGLRDVLNDESEDAIQRVWQRSRILDAISVMEANPCPAPVPVAVSERPWEREGWCHPQERWAWFYNRRIGWRDAIPPESLKPPTLFPYTHSLPANALPLPSGEVDE